MKLILIVFGIIALMVLSYFVWKSIPKKGEEVPGVVTQTRPGLFSILAELFGRRDRDKADGDKKDRGKFFCRLFPRFCEQEELSPEPEENGGGMFPSYG